MDKGRSEMKVKLYYERESLGGKKEVRTSRGIPEVGMI